METSRSDALITDASRCACSSACSLSRTLQNPRLTGYPEGGLERVIRPELNRTTSPRAQARTGQEPVRAFYPTPGLLAAPCAGLAVVAGGGLIAQTLVQRGL